jgi:hypothetical protein
MTGSMPSSSHRLEWGIVIPRSPINTRAASSAEMLRLELRYRQLARPPGPPDLLALATVAACGGTAFKPPLAWALEHFQSARFQAADLSLITGGEANLPPDVQGALQQVKTRTGVRIATVFLDPPVDTVAAWSDAVWPFAHLTRDGDAVAPAIFDQVTGRPLR